VDSQQCDIGQRVSADDVRSDVSAIWQVHMNLASPDNHVPVRDDQSIRAHDKS
jgi:hypothetical protein